jgi:hypothetical protein
MKKKSKKKVGFSIDLVVSDDLDNYCNQNLINKSQLVNKLIWDFLKKEINNVKTSNLEY